MITSKKGYYASDLLQYEIIDRYNKKIGKISDLLINTDNFRIEYLVTGKKGKKSPQHFIPASLVTSEEENKALRINQIKERLQHEPNQFSEDKKHILYSNLNHIKVHDIIGKYLGTIANLTYHKGLRVNILVGKVKEFFFNPFKLDFFVIPLDQIAFASDKNIVIQSEKEFLEEINMSDFEGLFTKDRLKTEKKRYIIVENGLLDIEKNLKDNKQKIDTVKKTHNITIEPIDIANDKKVAEFVELFNFILLNSPDTYVPINEEIVKAYFSKGTFVAYQHKQAIGYTSLTIQDNTFGVISGIGIHPNHRGKKLALILLEQAMEYFRSAELKKIQADIYDSNVPSLNLFSSFGFKEIGEVFLD